MINYHQRATLILKISREVRKKLDHANIICHDLVLNFYREYEGSLSDIYQRLEKVVSTYHRSGFDCKILMIVNCEFFWSLQSKESQSILECVTIIR